MKMAHPTIAEHVGGRAFAAAAFLCTFAFAPPVAMADEGGVSFWLPGLFGSLAAVPGQPGFSFANIYYHTTVSAGIDVAAAREVTIGRFNPTVSALLNGSLNASADLYLAIPSYVFATPVLGGQASVSMATIYGRSNTSLAATVSGSLGPIPFTRSDSIADSVTGFGDLYPQATLKWNNGVHNFMTYVTGDIPVGTYDSTRLANLGIGHGAIDGGGGYTYFNPQTGHEFSAVAGFTYNFVNPATNYQNGVDFHMDLAAAQFLSKQVFIGAVGYIYDQVSGDSGSGDKVGSFESRVFGVGPQLGYLFPIGNMQGYLNLKAYFEFDSHDRPSGWNTWLTFAISPGAPPAPTSPPSRSPMIYK
jgi:hypothetical protein